MSTSPVKASPFLPDPPRPPAPRHRRPLDAVIPASALQALVTPGAPRWAYTSILASLVGSQRGLSRLRAELLAGHSIDSDRTLADLVGQLDDRAGHVADPEPSDAPSDLIADQRLIFGIPAWSRSVTLAGVCRPVTRSADPLRDPRVIAILELLAAGGAAAADDADLLAVVGCALGRFGIDILPRDGSMPVHVTKAARAALWSASVTEVAAELVGRAGGYFLSSVARGRPVPPAPPPLRWSCETCPLDPPPVFARQAMLLTHRGHRHRSPVELGYVLDAFGVWQVDDREPTFEEVNRARMHAVLR